MESRLAEGGVAANVGRTVGDDVGADDAGTDEGTAVEALAAEVGTAVGLTATPVAVGFATAVEGAAVPVGAVGAAVETVGSAPSSLVGAGDSAGPPPTAAAATRGLADGSGVPVEDAVGSFGFESVLHAATNRPTAQQRATATNGLSGSLTRRPTIEAPISIAGLWERKGEKTAGINGVLHFERRSEVDGFYHGRPP